MSNYPNGTTGCEPEILGYDAGYPDDAPEQDALALAADDRGWPRGGYCGGCPVPSRCCDDCAAMEEAE